MDKIGVITSFLFNIFVWNIPLLYGTGNRRKAFGWATLSGLAEPLGALVGMLILLPFLSPTLLAVLFAVVAGIMVYISFDELLPMAERWGHHHLSIYGVPPACSSWHWCCSSAANQAQTDQHCQSH